MDLAAMMNDGGDALHRGSVDHREKMHSAETRKLEKKRPEVVVPVWARIYGGAANKVRDERFAQFKETRAEFKSVETNTGAQVAVEPSRIVVLPSNQTLPPSKASEVGPGGNLSLTGLAPSMAALIPTDDVCKVLAAWIFEQLTKIEDVSLYKHIEVEFRLGQIADENTRMRHRFPSLNESVVDTAYWARSRLFFRSGVDSQQFNRLVELLDQVAAANVTNETNQIAKENKLLRDDTYKLVLNRFGLGPKSIRVTTDENGRFIDSLYKQRLGDLYVAMPNSKFDLKMTLSIEHPVEEGEIKPLVKNMNPTFQRNKNRLSWVAPGCRADLTSVHGAGQAQSAIGAQDLGNVTREVEIEANTELLASSLTSFKLNTDDTSLDRFLEVIRYTLDSARYVIRNS